MKRSGIIRKIDDLGRIVIPMEIRKLLGINLKDDMEFYINDSNEVVIKRVNVNYNLSSIASTVADYIFDTLKEPTFVTNCSSVLGVKGENLSDFTLTERAKDVVQNQNYTSFNGGNAIEIVENLGYYAEIFMPIKKDNAVIGAVIVASKTDNFNIEHLRYLKLAVGILEIFINE